MATLTPGVNIPMLRQTSSLDGSLFVGPDRQREEWERIVDLVDKKFPGASRIMAIQMQRELETGVQVPVAKALALDLEATFALTKLGDFTPNAYLAWMQGKERNATEKLVPQKFEDENDNIKLSVPDASQTGRKAAA